MAAHAQKALAKMQAAYGYWRPLHHAAVSDKGQTAHGSDLHPFRGHVWRVWDTTKAVKDKMSAVVKKALRSILALHPRDRSSTFCTGTLGFHPVYSLIKLCWQHRCQNMEAGRWPKEALRFSEGSRGVGRPKVARTGAVMSNPLLSRSSTLNIAKVTAQAKGQPALRRVAPRRSPASTPYVVSLRWTHRMMTMTSRRWRWVSARGSADQPGSLR
jgi:hypothetical protein